MLEHPLCQYAILTMIYYFIYSIASSVYSNTIYSAWPKGHSSINRKLCASKVWVGLLLHARAVYTGSVGGADYLHAILTNTMYSIVNYDHVV